LKILVTGGAGFLGSHLTRALLDQGHEVCIIDDHSTSSPGYSDKRAKVLWDDVCNLLHLADNGLDMDFDRIYHLACPASPPKYQADPIQTLDTCYTGTRNVLEMAKRCGARVLFTSTSEVYGDPTVHPQPEDYTGNVNTIGPRACYDEGKRVAETLCSEYAKKYGVEVRIARIFNTYGPGMNPDDGRVITNFIQQAKAGKPLTIYGDGSQTRSFCYVSDTIRGLMMLMESDVTEPVNIGNPDEFTINELRYHVQQELLGPSHNSQTVHLPFPQHDPKLRRPDISRAIQRLGWYPLIRLDVGLRRMIEEMPEVVREGKVAA
jgi:UDP-glucuronate decarboxylase